jgi:hypothetical protein
MSERVIRRYEVPVDDRWHTVPLTGPIIYVGSRSPGIVELWAISDSQLPQRAHKYRVFGAGLPLPAEAGSHVGTALAAGGALVWHLFEGRADA